MSLLECFTSPSTKFLTGLKTEQPFGNDLRSRRVSRIPINSPLAFNEILRDGLSSSAAGARSKMAADTYADLEISAPIGYRVMPNEVYKTTIRKDLLPRGEAEWWPSMKPRIFEA